MIMQFLIKIKKGRHISTAGAHYKFPCELWAGLLAEASLS